MEWNIVKIKDLFIEIVEESGRKIKEIGEHGLKKVEGDNRANHAILADKVVSEIVREKLKGFPGIINSEDGKDIDFSGGNPEYLISCDEIDGTENLQTGKGMQPYCTILCAFDSISPKFKDALVAVIRVHTTGHLFYAIRDKGCYMKEPGKDFEKLTVTTEKEFTDRLKIRFDSLQARNMEMKQIQKLITKAWIKDFGSTGYHLASLSAGIVDAFVNPGAKGEELGAGYLLIKEAGGSIIDFEGNDINDQEFDQKKEYKIIAAATPELAKAILDEMNS